MIDSKNLIIVSMHDNTFKLLTKNQAIKYGKLLVMESFNYEKINTKYKYLNNNNKLLNQYDLKGRIISTTNIFCEYIITSDKEFFEKKGKD